MMDNLCTCDTSSCSRCAKLSRRSIDNIPTSFDHGDKIGEVVALEHLDIKDVKRMMTEGGYIVIPPSYGWTDVLRWVATELSYADISERVFELAQAERSADDISQRDAVLVWLGIHRDKMDPDLVGSLQRILDV